MTNREEVIINNEFFRDKKDLALQVINFENAGKGYLPNSPSYKLSPIYEINGKHVYIGRLHDFYYLAIKDNSNNTKHQLFESENHCKQFFTQFDEMNEQQIAFWLNQIEKLS